VKEGTEDKAEGGSGFDRTKDHRPRPKGLGVAKTQLGPKEGDPALGAEEEKLRRKAEESYRTKRWATAVKRNSIDGTKGKGKRNTSRGGESPWWSCLQAYLLTAKEEIERSGERGR